ncbi:LTA synthase family protein [Sphingobacterium sp. SG20118]|uniref:LTA synthase family protein n=1 Tax=Sphingobacterium sp. SG20118 TaxID=3367156 RepID=UPI0037DFBF82
MGNLIFAFQVLAIGGVSYLLFQFVSLSLARMQTILLLSFVVVMQYILFLYFSETRNLLGADMFYYNTSEMVQILEASGMLSLSNIAILLLLVMGVYIPFWMASKKTIKTIYVGFSMIVTGLMVSFIPVDNQDFFSIKGDEFTQNAARSKWRYFLGSNISNYEDEHPDMWRYNGGKEVVPHDASFPFLRNEDTKDALGFYFEKGISVPNLVIIVVEGLGHAFSSPSGYIGNFTPFIDSLSKKSLYWDNNLSSSGRTFSVLPTLTGSLPFATHGFLEQDSLPHHFNLFNILKANGFNTGFFYGGDAQFDYMEKFMTYNDIDTLVDQRSFSAPYKKLPEKGGESWGYEDQAVFSKLLEVQHLQEQPYFNLLLTLSTHNPFLINNAAYYEQLFDKRMATQTFSNEQRRWALENRIQLVSVLNLDDALHEFFKAYQKRTDFGNTIFVITGDHAMPEIPLQSKIDRYHVPLMIYSPLLKSAHTFHNKVSHFDLTPSLLAFYRENYHLKTPTQVTWVGKGLDEGLSSRGNGAAMMQSKNQLIDFVYGDYHLSDGQLYKVDMNFDEESLTNENVLEQLMKRFDNFKLKNKQFYRQKQLLPDSIYTNYFDVTISKP